MSNPYKTESKSFTIKEWNEDDRPREKLMAHGGSALSNSELLAILIGSGTKGFSAVDAARDMLKLHGNLNSLVKKSLNEIKQTKGIGDARAITLMAAFELGRRIESESISEKPKVTGPDTIYSLLAPKMRHLDVEVFKVLLLDTSNKILKEIDVAKGILNQVSVHPREIFKQAIIESAASIIAVHNHPSGNNTPSSADRDLTERLRDTGSIIGINLIDHIIIAGDTYYSFKGNNDVL